MNIISLKPVIELQICSILFIPSTNQISELKLGSMSQFEDLLTLTLQQTEFQLIFKNFSYKGVFRT